MSQLALSIIFVLFGLIPGLIAPRSTASPGATACVVPLSQTVRIPVSMLGAPERPESKDVSIPTLLISKGAVDELPEGPTGFDVLEDGSFVIVDPLRRRICLFDSQGKFQKAWKTGFPADSVTIMKNGLLAVEESGTDTVHVFDRDGIAKPQEAAVIPKYGDARVLSGSSGIVNRVSAGGTRPLEINYDRQGSRLLSLQTLSDDAEGNTFVAVEGTTAGDPGEEIRLNKSIRRYSGDGTLSREVSDIPLDYYVAAVDELRVHNGKVYQLVTTSTGVNINVWNTNDQCRHDSE